MLFTHLEGNDAASKDVDNIGARIHQVNLGKDTDCSDPFWIDFSRKLESIRIGQISVCSGNCQNDRLGVSNILDDHVSDLFLNVVGLIAYRDLAKKSPHESCEKEMTNIAERDTRLYEQIAPRRENNVHL